MAVGIAAGVRSTGSLGNTNPMDMMKSMMEVRNMQAEYQGKMALGQGAATARSLEEFQQSQANNPYLGFAMREFEQASSAYRNAAATGQINQMVGFQRLKAATLAGDDQNQTLQFLGDALKAAPPSEQPFIKDYIDSLSGKMSPEEFQTKRFGKAMALGGLSPEESFALTSGGLPIHADIAGQPTYGIQLPGTGEARYPGITPGAGPGAGQPPAAPSPYSYGYDAIGAPLYTGQEDSPAIRTSPQTGMPMLTPNQEQASNEAMKGHTQESFLDRQQLLTSLERMDGAYDNMARGGGFLAPGQSATMRGEIAGLSNVWAKIAGNEAPFDPSQITSIQTFLKETERLKGQVTNQFYGQGRHAAQTITDAGKAVPSIENTLMAGKSIIASLKAATQWNADLYRFENAWLADPQHHGNIFGADVAFAATHKAEDYSRHFLAEIGMKPGGQFIDSTAVRQAIDKGWLTVNEARNILKTMPSERRQ